MVDSNLVIPNPKNSRNGVDRFYWYYAAYSAEFARKTLSQIASSNGAIVVDPWNGSGTTTAAASDLGFKSVGLDLNPVAMIISHARFSSQADAARVKKAFNQLSLSVISK
jgi:DNA modification methylase